MNHSWKSKKSPIRTKNELDKEIKERRAEASIMSAEFSRRKRTSIESKMPSRSARQVWQPEKKPRQNEGRSLQAE